MNGGRRVQEKKFAILNGNHLKLIAAFAMLMDHAGILLLPKITLFRILGRLAYPIFAFMIAEGCRYTQNKLRYFLMVFGLGAACQLVYYFVSGDTYLNILLTFSCSILLIYCLQALYNEQDWLRQFLLSLLFACLFAGVYGLTHLVTIDYGFWGVMVPVFVSLAHVRQWPSWAELLLLGAGLLFLAADLGGTQPYGMLSLLILVLYNGQRGKCNMKYFFYIFYPVHMAVLQGIAWLVR